MGIIRNWSAHLTDEPRQHVGQPKSPTSFIIKSLGLYMTREDVYILRTFTDSIVLFHTFLVIPKRDVKTTGIYCNAILLPKIVWFICSPIWIKIILLALINVDVFYLNTEKASIYRTYKKYNSFRGNDPLRWDNGSPNPSPTSFGGGCYTLYSLHFTSA